MSISDSSYEYESDAKRLWREWVYSQILERSLNVVDDGPNKVLKGKWLEPIGKNAKCFEHILSKGIIKAESLIGIDGNPNDLSSSEININRCKNLFKKSTFFFSEWEQFCYSYNNSDIKYIIYDLFTSTHGNVLRTNFEATSTLITKSLESISQVILVINADLQVMKRQNSSLKAFRKTIENSFGDQGLQFSKINLDEMYTYKASSSSDLMGSIILEFFKK